MHLDCFALSEVAGPVIPAPPQRDWMDAFTDNHAYRCLPLAVGNCFGWQVLCPCEVAIDFDGGMDKESIRIRTEDDSRFGTRVAQSNFTRGILTLHTGYLFRTEPGWQLIATGPLNTPKDGLSPLTGIVETSWLPYPFTMNWQLMHPGRFMFQKNEPICHIIPYPVGVLEKFTVEIRRVEDDQPLAEEYARFRNDRTEFLDRLLSGDSTAIKQAWQRYYFVGEMPTGTKAPPTHLRKLRLAQPTDRRNQSVGGIGAPTVGQ